jgi:hypothetical protein
MPAIPLATCEARLALYLAAEAKILLGQAVEIDGEKLTRANLEAVQTGIELWSKRVQNATIVAAGRGRSRVVAPGW